MLCYIEQLKDFLSDTVRELGTAVQLCTEPWQQTAHRIICFVVKQTGDTFMCTKDKCTKNIKNSHGRCRGRYRKAEVFHVAHLINCSPSSIFNFHLQMENRTAPAPSPFIREVSLLSLFMGHSSNSLTYIKHICTAHCNRSSVLFCAYSQYFR